MNNKKRAGQLVAILQAKMISREPDVYGCRKPRRSGRVGCQLKVGQGDGMRRNDTRGLQRWLSLHTSTQSTSSLELATQRPIRLMGMIGRYYDLFVR